MLYKNNRKELIMPNVFLTSDTHFGHANICKFTNYDGSPVRPWDSVEEMDEEMVKRWNETVGPKDKVYHLGDVVINRRALATLDRLNGDKVLIKGNHDIFPLKDYVKYFRDIRAYHVMNGMILSHIPVSKGSIARFGTNIHGHTHGNRVMKTVGIWPFKKQVIDPDYFCVCVEQTDFRPILFEDAIKRIKDQGGQVGFRNGNGPTVD
jgi:calcineurin-like phosphoesterase family protein